MTITVDEAPGQGTASAADLEARLRQALEGQHFVLHYQPKMDARSRSITGVEALMRWNDPASGLIDPGRFMPTLEQTGLIVDVGSWALRQALTDVCRWRELGIRIKVAVNVAGAQLQHPDFVPTVRQALDQTGGKDLLDIELSEAVIMEDVERSITVLRALNEVGVNVAVDHFGSSRSSLAHIARLPIQSVKIDGVFVDGAVSDPGTKTVVATLISLAHTLGFTVIAKGVESEEQWKLLRTLRCDEVQGYLFSPARPAANITRMLQIQSAPRRFR